MSIAEIALKAFIFASFMIVATATLLQFFPSIKAHATYNGIRREVYLRQERGRVIMGANRVVLAKRHNKVRVVRSTKSVLLVEEQGKFIAVQDLK